jgi:PAS domain S-box-containing protein
MTLPENMDLAQSVTTEQKTSTVQAAKPLEDISGSVPQHGQQARVTQETRFDLQGLFVNNDLKQILKQVFENIPDQVFIKDKDHRIIACNLATAKTWSKKCPEEMLGMCDHDHFEKEIADKFRAIEDQVMENLEEMVNVEENYQLANGSEYWSLSTKVALRDSAGEVLGLIGINRDITQRKQMEEELRKAREIAENAKDNLLKAERRLAVVDFADLILYHMKQMADLSDKHVNTISDLSQQAPMREMIDELNLLMKQIPEESEAMETVISLLAEVGMQIEKQEKMQAQLHKLREQLLGIIDLVESKKNMATT